MTNTIVVTGSSSSSSTRTVDSESTFEKNTESKPITLCKFAEDYAEEVLRLA
jgi:hypothetical protein